MITYLFNQAALAGFNIINSRVDAYRILRHKTIAHGINFCAYAVFALILYYLTIKPSLTLTGFPYLNFCMYLPSAFTNRQFSFDIPLNLRRHLKWDYVSLDNPPKAMLDRLEIRIWGYNGRAPVVFYGTTWLVCLILKFFL